MSAIIGPVAIYSNLPIEAQFYQPSRFEISALTTGVTTTVTTSTDHNYVIGQRVRLIIPQDYGCFQLNETDGIVISVPSTTQVTVEINSTDANSFIADPYTATITNITQASPAVVTATNYFTPFDRVLITGVAGMTELNNNIYTVVAATSSSFSLAVNSTAFTAYTGSGTASLFPHQTTVPQILAIGDVNSGAINTNGRTQNQTYINGSFIDISPN